MGAPYLEKQEVGTLRLAPKSAKVLCVNAKAHGTTGESGSDLRTGSKYGIQLPQLNLHTLPSIAQTRLGLHGAGGQAASREPGRVQTLPRVSDPTCATVELKANSKRVWSQHLEAFQYKIDNITHVFLPEK